MVYAPGKTEDDSDVVCKTEQTALLHYLVLMCGLRPGGDTRPAVDALLHRVETTANAKEAADCSSRLRGEACTGALGVALETTLDLKLVCPYKRAKFVVAVVPECLWHRWCVQARQARRVNAIRAIERRKWPRCR